MGINANEYKDELNIKKGINIDDIINSSKINENIFNIQSDNKNANTFIKNNFFKITNINSDEKSDMKKDNFNPKNIQLKEFDNKEQIKVLKNNKAVYINNYELNSPSISKKVKKLNKITFIGTTKRSSRFRGVSKNGNQWQVLFMYKKGKSYVGSYTSEEIAAKIYDILSIKYRGIKARTNFKYTCEQIEKINNTEIDIKSKNISDIISQLV